MNEWEESPNKDLVSRVYEASSAREARLDQHSSMTKLFEFYIYRQE